AMVVWPVAAILGYVLSIAVVGRPSVTVAAVLLIGWFASPYIGGIGAGIGDRLGRRGKSSFGRRAGVYESLSTVVTLGAVFLPAIVAALLAAIVVRSVGLA